MQIVVWWAERTKISFPKIKYHYTLKTMKSTWTFYLINVSSNLQVSEYKMKVHMQNLCQVFAELITKTSKAIDPAKLYA